MYYIIIAAIVVVDQVTKYMVQTNMRLNDTIPLVDGIFHFTYIHNYGAAFSIMENRQVFLLLFTGVVIVGIAIYLMRHHRTLHGVANSSLALIVGGGLGNLIDRGLHGYVVDFLDFRIWPIFNVADMAVVSGCVLLVIYIVVIEPKLQKKETVFDDGREEHVKNGK